MPLPRAVLIDWYGTLSVSKLWGHWEDDPGDRGRHFAHIQRLWRCDWNGLILDWCRGAYVAEEVVARFARELGIPEPVLMAEMVESFAHTRYIDPAIPSLVHRLREKGVIVGIASDNADVLDRWIAPAMGLDEMFDPILNSYRRKALKGELDADGRNAFFREFVDDLGARPGEVVLIDDSRSSIDAVRREGIDYRLVPFGRGLAEELCRLLHEPPDTGIDADDGFRSNQSPSASVRYR